ncbi:hypothetical protein M9H77_08526 [Catharanthus roseus]|uniref:Uncharacterized protein n=1 Tax=Catharanthus roseus TaxID=4058 RepID=A0ACC0BYE5_CATRO|nr:hypothetical protein M9H77_08526 [Catharanthus roseus]
MEGGEKKKVVMVAIDSSECSHYALEWALHNSLLNSDQLLIFTVQPISDLNYLVASSMGSAPPELIRNFQQQQQKAADTLLKKAKELCDKHGITATTVTEVGDPKEKISEAVEKFNVTLLILGSHGRGPLQRLVLGSRWAFLGSVSNFCVHNVKCPVLVVKKRN